MSNLRRAGLALAIAVPLLACAGMTPTPVPSEKMDYVGSWTGGPISLDIEAGGTAHYKKDAGNVHTEVNGNIVAWRPDGFDVGLGPISTSFAVADPPHADPAGTWTMTVDGQVLTRPGGAPEREGTGRGRKEGGRRGEREKP